MAKKIEKKFAVIRIGSSGEEGEQNPVPVKVGTDTGQINVRITRDELVPVEWPVVEALRNAKKPVCNLVKDSRGLESRRKITSMVQRFPVEIVAQINEAQFDSLRAIAKVRQISDAELDAVLSCEPVEGEAA